MRLCTVRVDFHRFPFYVTWQRLVAIIKLLSVWDRATVFYGEFLLFIYFLFFATVWWDKTTPQWLLSLFLVNLFTVPGCLRVCVSPLSFFSAVSSGTFHAVSFLRRPKLVTIGTFFGPSEISYPANCESQLCEMPFSMQLMFCSSEFSPGQLTQQDDLILCCTWLFLSNLKQHDKHSPRVFQHTVLWGQDMIWGRPVGRSWDVL